METTATEIITEITTEITAEMTAETEMNLMRDQCQYIRGSIGEHLIFHGTDVKNLNAVKNPVKNRVKGGYSNNKVNENY